MKHLQVYESWFDKKLSTEDDIKKFIIDHDYTKSRQKYFSQFSGKIPAKFKINNGVKSSLLSVDVEGGLYIFRYKKSKLPFKFGRISNDFIFRGGTGDDVVKVWRGIYRKNSIYRHLKTLENFPDRVGRDFEFTYTKVTTFKGGPTYVGGNYDCNHNDIRDFYGFPETLRGKLKIYDNPVYDILYMLVQSNMFAEVNEQQLRFIYLLNDYTVIRNGNTIIKDRMDEALYGIGSSMPSFMLLNDTFKNYKLI